MPIKIVADSTCDLPPALAEEHGITIVPAFINIGEQSLRDGIDITRAEFYERLPGYNPPPTTAAPSPEHFRRAYEELAANGATEILSIHLSSTLSGLCAAAQMGAQETTRLPVTVFDSRQVSMGAGFMVLTAARAAAEGKTVPEIIALLTEQIQRTHIFAALDTLEYLRRSGRVSLVEAGLGGLLQIKPILKVFDGAITTERVRTRSQAMTRLMELLREIAPLDSLAVLHTNARSRAEGLLTQLATLRPAGDVPIMEATSLIGTHIGPGTVAVVGVKT